MCLGASATGYIFCFGQGGGCVLSMVVLRSTENLLNETSDSATIAAALALRWAGAFYE
jgi:hypothetical protein